MLEIWIEKAIERCRAGAGGGKSAAGRRSGPLAFLAGPGIWIAAATLALAGGRILWPRLHRPAHREEIAAAFGAAGRFYGEPQINHDGRWFAYVAASDTRGSELVLYETATGRKRRVSSQGTGAGYFDDEFNLHVWPWSPDDRLLVYTAMDKLTIQPIAPVVGDEVTSLPGSKSDPTRPVVPDSSRRPLQPQSTNAVGDEVTSLSGSNPDPSHQAAQLTTGNNTVSDLVWLNPAEFAYLDGGVICYAQRLPDGHWESRQLPRMDGVSCLRAASTNAVAWLQDNFICRQSLPDIAEELAGATNAMAWLQDFIRRLSIPDSAGGVASATNASAGLVATDVQPPTNHLVLRLDASILTLTNQQPATSLADLSASRNDTVVNGKPPLFNAPGSPGALNGKGTLHFLSSGRVTNSSGLKTRSRLGISGYAPRTVLAVVRRDARRQMLINMGDAAGRRGAYFGVNDQNDALYLPGGWGNADNKVFRSPAGWHLLEVVYDGSSQRGYVNGVLRASASFEFDTTNKPVEIGLRTGKSAAGSDGDFAELLVYDKALDSTERRQVETYLSAKWLGNRLLSAQRPVVWHDPEMTGITGFSYSEQTGQFLLNRSENWRDSLWRYDPRSDEATQLFEASSIRNVQWTAGASLACLVRDHGQSRLVSSIPPETGPLEALEKADIEWAGPIPGGRKWLLLGTATNELCAGLWQYDTDAGQLQALVPYSDHPSPHARPVVPFHAAIKLPSGRSADCAFYPPANFDRHQTYPLLIADTWRADPIHGELLHSGIAACGVYVVIAERGTWYGGIEQWAECVTAIRQEMAREPFIDPRRVYLYGASAETQYLSQMLARSPGPWRGVILLNPSQLPDFSDSPFYQSRPKILISAGSLEDEETRFQRFQAKAANSGALVDVLIHPGEGHRLMGKAAKLARTQAMTRFIFEE